MQWNQRDEWLDAKLKELESQYLLAEWKFLDEKLEACLHTETKSTRSDRLDDTADSNPLVSNT